MGKTSNELFGLLKIVALIVVGVFVFLFVRDRYAKTKEEKEADKEFKERGALASFGRFLFGDAAFDSQGATPDTTTKEQDEKVRKELAEIERLNELAQQQAKEEKEIRKEAERQAQKDIEKDPNKDVAARIDELEKQIRQQREQEKKTGKDETFDRSKDDFRIFRFSKPIQTPTGHTVSDFAIKVVDPKTLTNEQRKKLQEEARAQVKALGLGGKDKLGRDLTPIVGLTAETIKRLETDPRLRQAIENSQLRRLGLR